MQYRFDQRAQRRKYGIDMLQNGAILASWMQNESVRLPLYAVRWISLLDTSPIKCCVENKPFDMLVQSR